MMASHGKFQNKQRGTTMANKAILSRGRITEKVYLTLSEDRQDSPPKEWGWKKMARFRRYEGEFMGEEIDLVIWDGTEAKREGSDA